MAQEFECLGHSNWIICSNLSQFYSQNFTTFSLLCWEANSYYPREGKAEMGKWISHNLSMAQEFECLGLSNWTICCRLSQFYCQNFTTFSLSCWEANSHYPREGKAEMGKLISPNLSMASMAQEFGKLFQFPLFDSRHLRPTWKV